MGYQTQFSLSSIDPTNHEVQCPFNEMTQEKIRQWGEELQISEVEELIEGYSMCAKWYEHQDDMKVLSKSCPDVLFLLTGEGEELEDRWMEYYLNGKVQVCRGEVTVSTIPWICPNLFESDPTDLIYP